MGQLVLFFWARLSWCCLGPIVHLYPAGWSLGRVLQHGPSCGDWAVLHADSYSRPIWKAIREGQRPRWKHKNLARQQSAGDKVLWAPAEKVPMGTQAPFCPSNLIPWLEIESTFRWEEAVTLKRAWMWPSRQVIHHHPHATFSCVNVCIHSPDRHRSHAVPALGAKLKLLSSWPGSDVALLHSEIAGCS